MNLQKQLKKWYLLEFIGNFSIYEAVSILFLLQRGFTLLDFGIAEGCFHVVSFLCEIPSGMFADIFGRKYVLALGQFFFAAAALAMIFSKTLFGIILCYAFTALGYNMSSGTREALCYDSLVMCGAEKQYLSINSNGQIYAQAAMILGNLCAGFALIIGYKYAYALRVLTALFSMGLALFMQEPNIPGKQKETFSFSMLFAALKVQIKESALFLWKTPRAARIMATTGLAACARVLVMFYIQEQLQSSGASGFFVGFALVIIGFGPILGAKLAKLFEKRFTLTISSIFCILLTALGIALSAFTGSIAMIILGGFLASLFEMILFLTTDAALNHMFDSGKRATLVSASSMVFSIFMLPASPLSGKMADSFGLPATFLTFSGVLVLAAAGIYLLQKRIGKRNGFPS
ncbi:MAG: MFS transporter [Christensenellaceae bacterium]|jgi:MFS family permease